MLTLLIVDDQPSVLDALRQCFALEPDLLIVGKAADGEEALKLVKQLHPDIVLTDVKMPIMDGLTATAAMLEAAPDTKIVVLSIYDNQAMRDQAFAAGASAFVGKHDTAEALLAAVRGVAKV